MGEMFATIRKQVCVAASEREQTVFRRCMRLDRTVDANMTKLQSAFGQRPADQQTAVAVKRLALGTQQTDAVVRGLIHDSREPGGEFRPRGHGLVVGDAVAIKLRIARASAERIA